MCLGRVSAYLSITLLLKDIMGSCISSNISLDLLLSSIYLVYLIKNHLLEKMKIEMQILKLPKSLKNHFPVIDGRAFETNSLLWEKFDDARNSRGSCHASTGRNF